MLISGILECTKCNKTNEWEYIVPQKLGTEPLQVERLDDNKIHPIKKYRLSETEYLLQCRCKYCDALNQFTYHSERYL